MFPSAACVKRGFFKSHSVESTVGEKSVNMNVMTNLSPLSVKERERERESRLLAGVCCV